MPKEVIPRELHSTGGASKSKL